MKKRNAALSLMIAALLSLGPCRTASADMPSDNVQGDWTIYSTNIENGETVVKHVQIAQYGNRITGYFEGPVQSGPIQGRVDVHHIVFSTVTRNVLTFRGQIYGDQMSGEYGLHGKHAAWQAVRQVGTAGTVPPQTGVVYSSQPILSPPAPAPVPTPEPAIQSSYSYSSAPQPMAQPSADVEPPSQPAPQAASYPAQGSSAPAPAPLSADQLDSLVAPIALYPDALVAQVLAAATNPDQVAYADDWLAQNKDLTAAGLAQAADQQSWDPSVKALTQFPSVLDNLAHNPSWTSSLGQAFAYQQSDVMAAVQTMRSRARAAGTLQSTSQITVTQPTPTTIVIQPANPQVVYIPQYNPTAVYGAPVVVPLYVPPPMPVAAGLYFGAGISIGATFGGGGWGGGFGWGWHAWGVNWGCCAGGNSTTIIYNHNTYINNHTWNSNSYNGYHPWAGGVAGSQNHAWYGANGTFHPDGNYKPGGDTHYGPNGAYHPNGYFGPDGGFHPDKGTGPSKLPNGGNNGNHSLIGGNGAVQNPNAGKNGPGVAPNGGYSNNGLLGSGRNLGTSQTTNANRSDLGAQQNRSRFSGDGRANRIESNRGRGSMDGRPSAQPRMARMRQPVQQHFSGGGRRR